MSSKNKKELEKNPKVIRCTNCRQDISSEKMFLHEGFCHRNNKYCEHCDQVFLKEDYEKHAKKIATKNINEKTKKFIKKEIEIEETEKVNQIVENENVIKNVNNIEEEIATVVKKSVTTINPQTVEYLHMPLTEEYTTINNPIIISPNGQIVSNKNKNDYLLPYLGINLIQNNYNNNLSNLNLFSTDQNFNYDTEDFLNAGKQNNFTDIQNSFNFEDIDINKIYQTETNINSRNNIDFITNGELLINEKANNNNNNYYNYNSFQVNNQINRTYDNKLFDGNEINDNLFNSNGLNNIYKNSTTEFNIIKKNINNEKKDLHRSQNKKKNIKINSKIVKKALLKKNQSNKINAKIPLDKNKSHNKPINININHNKIVKEPTDNNSKINIKSKISLMKQDKNKNPQKQPMNKINKKYGNMKDVKDSKRKNSYLDESLFQSTDENGIDEMKKKVLQRELMPNSHFISFNNDGIMTYRNFSNNNNSVFLTGDSQKFSYRKKLMKEANTNLSQQELFSKTQGRYFKNKKNEIIIRLNDNSQSFQSNKIRNSFEQSPINLTNKGNKKKGFLSESRNIQKNKNIFINLNNNKRKNSLYK